MTKSLKKLFGTGRDLSTNKYNQINMMAFNYHDLDNKERGELKKAFIDFYATTNKSPTKNLRKYFSRLTHSPTKIRSRSRSRRRHNNSF